MADVTVQNVGKSYGAHRIMNGVSLEILEGEFVILVGPSGCGKSTLLRMIAGLEDVTSGIITIGGRVVNDMPPKSRDIAMVFQNYGLYPHKNVAANMSFALKMRGVARAEIDAKVKRAAAILGLEDLLSRLPKQLSGGQRQRVAMGRAIVRDPQVFLFDEPLSNLDAKLRVQMRAEIKERHQRFKTTTIYVTHDQIEAMTMADKIVVMRNGAIEQVGAPLELYDRPANTFVATFIGSPAMNIIKGLVIESGFQIDTEIILPLPPGATRSAAMYGLRPEHIILDEGGVPAKVQVVEPMGSETQIVMRLGTQSIVGSFRQRVNCRPGETICISPDLSAVHLFGADGIRFGHS